MQVLRLLNDLPVGFFRFLQCEGKQFPVIGLKLHPAVFLQDPGYDPNSDCFLCGPDILACPVFDEGATEMTVTLPDLGSGWRLRGRGPLYPAGETLTLPCLPTDDPLWFVRSR